MSVATQGSSHFFAEVADHSAKALGTSVEGPWTAESIVSNGEALDGRLTFSLSGELKGRLQVAFSESSWESLATANAAVTNDLVEKVLEKGLVAMAASGQHADWQARIEESVEGQSSVSTNHFALVAADGRRLIISLSCDEELAEALESKNDAASSAEDDPAPVNLDLVLDVELNVVLRFGQRQLTLREVLDLSSGAVVELDRQVEEPVDLLLEGKVIARGEAVVIDGNYGLRVTEVPQPISQSMLAH